LQVPVLTYHALNMDTNDYVGNDHIALSQDLRALHAAGFRVVPLSRVVDWHEGLVADGEMHHAVALTLDDGTWFDYYDLEHPKLGMQRSMFNILRDARTEMGEAQAGMTASSFVITSPEVRHELDVKGMVGKGWWGDEWWREAQASGLMSIECHSWDHNHPALDQVAQQDQVKGDFRSIASYYDCDVQVTRAGDYIEHTLRGQRPGLFAYPWGQASDYLLHEFMPQYQARHRFRAAFSCEPRAVSKADNVWFLPRFVCGRDWKSSGELLALVAQH
jgi:hypothetical protein